MAIEQIKRIRDIEEQADQIRRKSKEEARNIAIDAEKEATILLERAEQEADAIYKEILAEGEKKAQVAYEEIINRAKAECEEISTNADKNVRVLHNSRKGCEIVSIASMKKLSVIGLASEKKALMKSLMRLGVVEITTQEGKMTDEEWSRLVSLDGNESAVSEYDSRLLTIEQALDAFSKYGTEKKPLFQTRKPVKRNDFEQKLKEKEEIEAEAKKIASLSARILELNTEANKVEANKLSLLPWKDYDIPLEVQGTKETEIAMGVVPSVSDVKEFEKDLKEKTERCLVELVNSDAEQHYLCALSKGGARRNRRCLKLYGFTRTTFSDLQGSVASNIEAFDKKLSAIAEEKERVIEEIQSRQGSREDVEYLHDSLIIERDQAAIRSRLLLTKKSFYLDGWVPRIALDEVEKLLKDHGCYYEIESPSKDEETPILLLKHRFNSPLNLLQSFMHCPILKR